MIQALFDGRSSQSFEDFSLNVVRTFPEILKIPSVVPGIERRMGMQRSVVVISLVALLPNLFRLIRLRKTMGSLNTGKAEQYNMIRMVASGARFTSYSSCIPVLILISYISGHVPFILYNVKSWCTYYIVNVNVCILPPKTILHYI